SRALRALHSFPTRRSSDLGIVIVDPDRLAGTLICGGGIIGLIGSVASLSLLLGVPSFALVLLLGIYSFGRRKEGRLLAGGVLWRSEERRVGKGVWGWVGMG